MSRADGLRSRIIKQGRVDYGEHAHGSARGPAVRLLGRPEILALTSLSYPTIWKAMREGRFPRSRVVGGKSMWLSTEIERWLSALPVRPLKAADPDKQKISPKASA